MKILIAVVGTFVVTSFALAQTPAGPPSVPHNLGLGLRQLVTLQQQAPAQLQSKLASTRAIQSDQVANVIVNINLDGMQTAATVSASLAALGVKIIAVETHWRNGAITASIPVAQAVTIAGLPGVKSVMLARKPIRRIGKVTAESSVVEHADEVNAPGVVTAQGILGRGISVGIISDSYNDAAGVPRANVGVSSGDLPGPGNPNGYTQPVVVLREGADKSDTDEGRGMAEIVHDIAPAAKISFSSAGPSQVTYADSIRNLRTDSRTLCDVIVDDIGFPDEPIFSDGIVAQAVDDVVTSNTLAGKKVSYFSAAGNSPGGYSANAKILPLSTAQSYSGNLNLNSVPTNLDSGGIQNIGSAAAPVIAMPVTTGDDDSELVLQWDDPFNSGAVTTDYNLLVFNKSGQYLGSLSGTDDNFATDEPVEIIDLAKNTTYQLVIALASQNPPTAQHLRLLSADGNPITDPYFVNSTISIFGHQTAADANCVAAYSYSVTPDTVPNYNPRMTNPPPGPYEPIIETFNSTGGNLPFYFNSQGQRLSSPQYRLKPDFAAADGVDTSFFPAGSGNDYDNDGFPNFFGTSAAAPNAAAFAALVLEAGGGPGSLTPSQVHTTLSSTAYAHDTDPNYSKAAAISGADSVVVSASGDDSNASASSPKFFSVTFKGKAGETLNQVSIDMGATGLVFDPSTDLGFPFTVGQNAGGVSVTSSVSADSTVLTLTFNGGTFTSGKSISFGIDRDFAGIKADGNSADYLGGAVVTAVTNTQTFYGAFANQLGTAFSRYEGAGLLDARAAVLKTIGSNPRAGAPANLSTRGLVGTGDKVLIGGLIVNGSGPKKVLIRALGPSLQIAGGLANPMLDLYNANGVKIASDNNWQDNSTQAAEIRASKLQPSDPLESALVESLNPGNYTAIVSGVGATSGIGLVEFYDLDGSITTSRLANIATRGQVQTGADVLIAGFILSHGHTQVIMRALGPSLAPGVSGALGDPSMELHDSNGDIVMTNDNWQEDSFQAMEIQTANLAPANPLESALDLTLDPAAYTIIVSGAHGTNGVGLVEVYDIQ